MNTPEVLVEYSIAPGAEIGGCWIEDAAGKVHACLIFDPTRPLNAVGDGFVVVFALIYDRNAI